jgi:hypothetical protein
MLGGNHHRSTGWRSGPTRSLRPVRRSAASSLAHQADSRGARLNLRDVVPPARTLADAEAYVARVGAEGPVIWIVVRAEALGSVRRKPGADVQRRSAEIGDELGEVHRERGAVGALRGFAARGSRLAARGSRTTSTRCGRSTPTR